MAERSHDAPLDRTKRGERGVRCTIRRRVPGRIPRDFQHGEQLVSADTDSATDLYERSGGTTTLLSTGSIGGNAAISVSTVPPGPGPWTPPIKPASEDATHVFFYTTEALEPDDLDTALDVYEHSAGTTRLVSRGATPSASTEPAYLEALSADGNRAFFSTQEALVPQDTDVCTSSTYGTHGCADLYERDLQAATTALVSTGPNDANVVYTCTRAFVEGGQNECGDVVKASADGTRAFFFSAEKLTADDMDGRLDLYERNVDTGLSPRRRLSTGPSGGNGNYPAMIRNPSGPRAQLRLRSRTTATTHSF